MVPEPPESRVPPVLALPPALAPRHLQIRPQGTTCPVAAGGFCSLVPCVQFAGGGSGAALAGAASAMAVPSAVIAATAGGPAVLRPSLAEPTVKPAPPPGGSGCQGRPAPPKTLRVSGA